MMAVVVGTGLAAFVAAVAVNDLPPTPARQVLEPMASHVVDPLFTQTWTLFAPVPPTVNESFVLMVRYRAGAKVVGAHPIDVTALFRRMAEQTRWAPSRLYRVTMALAVELNRALGGIVPTRTTRGPSGLGAEADGPALADQVAAAQDYYAASALGTRPPLTRRGGLVLADVVMVELQRLLSAVARSVEPHPADLAAVRAVYSVTPIPPFTDRHARPRTQVILASGWLPYLPAVPS